MKKYQTETIADIMTTDVYTLYKSTPVLEAMRELLSRHISGAPVVSSDNTVIGILSVRDCLGAALNSYYHQNTNSSKVAEYMAQDVETLNPDTDIVTAATKFLELPYGRFPVVDNGVLLGQVSRYDLLDAMSKHWSGV